MAVGVAGMDTLLLVPVAHVDLVVIHNGVEFEAMIVGAMIVEMVVVSQEARSEET